MNSKSPAGVIPGLRRETATVDGVRLHYWIGGVPEGQPVLLWHGFLGTGFFSLFGAMLSELYPTALRGAGLGFVYNIGRGLSSVAPFVVGFFADRYGIGSALALNSAFFLLGAALIFTLPETKQVELS